MKQNINASKKRTVVGVNAPRRSAFLGFDSAVTAHESFNWKRDTLTYSRNNCMLTRDGDCSEQY